RYGCAPPGRTACEPPPRFAARTPPATASTSATALAPPTRRRRLRRRRRASSITPCSGLAASACVPGVGSCVSAGVIDSAQCLDDRDQLVALIALRAGEGNEV